MFLELDNYRLTSDERQFIISKKRVIQAGRLTKAENVGKEVWEEVKYYTDIKFALKFLGNSVLLDNDDIVVIKQKLDLLANKIEEFNKLLRR